jgi:hypothetical protein
MTVCTSLFLLFLLLGSLFSLSLVLLVGFVLSDLSVDSWGILLHGSELNGMIWLGHWENVTRLTGSSLLELLSSRIVDLILLVDTFSSWEKNKLALVFLKSCNILLV